MYRINWALIAVLWLTYFLNYVDRQVIFSLLPALKADIAMSDAALALIGSLFIWFYSLASPLGGRLADRFGYPQMILISLLLWTGATLATGLSTSVASLLVWRAAMGITEALYFPAAVGLLGALHSTEVRSRVIALHGSAQFAGVAAGGWFGGWMAERYDWRSAFLCLAVAGIVWLAVLWMLIRRTIGNVLPARKESGRMGDLGNRHFGALALAFFGLCAMLWIIYAWLPLWLHEKYQLSLSASGLQATLYVQMGALAGILAGGIGGDWARRRAPMGRYLVIGTGLLLSSPFAGWTFAAMDLTVATAAGGMFGVFSGVMMANTMAAAYDVVPTRSYGLAAGVLTMIGGSAGGLAILFAGVLKDSYGIEFIMRVAAIAAAASAVLILATAWRYPGASTA